MCVLSDGDIREAVAAGDLGVEPFEEGHLTPNGLDLVIAEVYLESDDERVHRGTVRVPPGGWFAVSTREVVTLGPRLAGQLWIRSTWARRGAVAGFGKVEAGFSGTLTIGAANLSAKPLELKVGDRFCQIVFERLERVPQSLYKDHSGNYQDQRGVTLHPRGT